MNSETYMKRVEKRVSDLYLQVGDRLSAATNVPSPRPGVGSEQGVALITVVILTAVMLIFGAGLYFIATRENRMAFVGQSGGQAFSYAEGGIENTLDILTYAATETQLTRLMPDQSVDGFGYLMDPEPTFRQAPSNPVEMKIGSSSFKVWVDEIDANGNHCTGCGFNMANPYYQTAYLLITAESQSSEGYRKLQVPVKITASGFPMAFYVDGDAKIDGNPILQNESMYVAGNVYGRDKITVSGDDLAYGTAGGASTGAAGVFATGIINGKVNNNSPIYSSSGATTSNWNANDANDRDSRGPTGNTFNSTKMQDILINYGIMPGMAPGLIMTLKSQAQINGYFNDNASNEVTVLQSDLPNRCGDVVVYIEFPGGDPAKNKAMLKFQWPPTGCTSGKAVIIVRNGSVKLAGYNMQNTYGALYCPDGSVTDDGDGMFTGFIWAKGAKTDGHFTYGLDSKFMNDPPFYIWTVTRMNNWVEVDR